MKLGEVKIEALKLMFANGKEDITISELADAELGEKYGDYLINMPGAINRCFSILEEKRVLPSRLFVLGDGGRYNLSELIADFFDVERIVYEGRRGYNVNCEYFREGDAVIIPDYRPDGEYRILYKPSIKRVTDITSNDAELDIPERIACYIPYFIKSELFRVDEPDEAAEARNFFEAALSEIFTAIENRQTKSYSRYSFGEV